VQASVCFSKNIIQTKPVFEAKKLHSVEPESYVIGTEQVFAVGKASKNVVPKIKDVSG
jgi:hypothetical protein